MNLSTYRFLVILFVSCSASTYGQDYLYSDHHKYPEVLSNRDISIHFYGLTTRLDSLNKATLLPHVIITAVDIHKDAIMVNSNGFAYYDLPLKQNNKYTIYYEYQGMYTQFLELDTSNKTKIIKKSEYLLPTNTLMTKNQDPQIAAFYLENPTEKIYWKPHSNMLIKDKLYADSFEAKLKLLQND